MASQSTFTPWWSRDKAAGLNARIRAIQRVNDPTTNADEVLTGSKILLFALLLFSGLLGAINYYKNFSQSFPFALALFMSLILPFAIEWGKNRCATWAVRLPFFQGFKAIFSTPANTFIFLGLVAVAAATFTMSVINSTKGAEQLSLMLSHERNQSPFQPDTRDLDAQIAAAQKSIDDNRNIKWKGTVTYQAQKAIQSQTRSLETLQRMRQDRLGQQRTDWEKQQSIQEDQSNYTAGIVLASGGWVELIQFLLIFLRVSCEKILDGRTAPTPSGGERQPMGFNRQQPATAEAQTGPTFETAPRRYMGFNVDPDTGNVLSSSRSDHAPQNISNISVAQTQQAVAQMIEPEPGVSAEEIIKFYLGELRKEPANFNNRHASTETVARRIHEKLNRASLAIYKMIRIDIVIAGSFCKYLRETIEPVLIHKGYPYTGFDEIEAMLNERSLVIENTATA